MDIRADFEDEIGELRQQLAQLKKDQSAGEASAYDEGERAGKHAALEAAAVEVRKLAAAWEDQFYNYVDMVRDDCFASTSKRDDDERRNLADAITSFPARAAAAIRGLKE